MKVSQLHSFVLGISFIAAIALSSARAAAGVPTEQIRATVDKALIVLKDPKLRTSNKTQERRDQLRQILFSRFDFNEMAKRALGAEWRRRSPAEQEEFARLFTELLERAYSETIESYTDEKIIYVGEKQEGRFANVNSKILTSKGQEYSIDYKVHLLDNEWKVYDIVVENISMVNNFRSQFSRVLNNSSYEELVRRLRAKAEYQPDKK
ncbi:MAG TPA: ABC transporter substrate-binding protein [Candidatus Binatia bacterium]|jgi:phospholipid transport system substrate-binding protein